MSKYEQVCSKSRLCLQAGHEQQTAIVGTASVKIFACTYLYKDEQGTFKHVLAAIVALFSSREICAIRFYNVGM